VRRRRNTSWRRSTVLRFVNFFYCVKVDLDVYEVDLHLTSGDGNKSSMICICLGSNGNEEKCFFLFYLSKEPMQVLDMNQKLMFL